MFSAVNGASENDHKNYLLIKVSFSPNTNIAHPILSESQILIFLSQLNQKVNAHFSEEFQP